MSETTKYRVMVAVGALIVFTTFIVKDAWREYLRNRVESLRLAEAVFSIRQDNLQSEHVASMAVGAAADIVGSCSRPDKLQLLQEIMSYGQSRLAINGSVMNIGNLLDQFPNTEDDRRLRAIWTAKNQLDPSWDALSSLAAELDAAEKASDSTRADELRAKLHARFKSGSDGNMEHRSGR